MLGPTLDAGTLANGKTVRLVPPQESHLDACVRWLNDPRITRYLSMVFGINRAREDNWYEAMVKDPDCVNWAIEVDEAHVGQTGIEQIAWLCRTGSTGIMIGEPQYWNQGIAKATMRARTDFAFKRLNLVALYTEVFTPNTASLQATQRVGYREYGVRPYARFDDGEYLDAWLGVLTREDWERTSAGEDRA